MVTEERVLQEARHIIATDQTIRVAAKHLKCTPSLLHRDLRVSLPTMDIGLARTIDSIFKRHIEEGRSKGGMISRRVKDERKNL